MRLYETAGQCSRRVAELLETQTGRIVFAESCTAGLVSAVVAWNPGISKWLCGSSVTYQEEVKSCWLGVDPRLIESFTAVSPQVTNAMVLAVLEKTPTACWGVAVTGHLEPETSLSGPLIHVSSCRRMPGGELANPDGFTFVLCEGDRIARQWEAVSYVLEVTAQLLESGNRSGN